jgi:hypothetical protein
MRNNAMKHFYIFVIILTVCFCNKQNEIPSFPDSALNLEITKKHFLDGSVPDSMQIYTPGALQTDSSGNVYVVDIAKMDIKVFNRNGAPLNIFGGKGKGPGEFISNSGFFIYRETIHLFDQKLKRLNIFSTDGRLKRTVSLNVSDPISLKPVGDENHLGIYANKPASKNNTDGDYARVLDKNFNQIGETFLNISEKIPELEELERFLGVYPGHFLMVSSDEFIYTPYYYNGKLYQYKRAEGGSWEHVNTYSGNTDRSPFTNLDDISGRHFDVGYTSFSENKTLKYVVHNQSRGLLKHEKKIYHFTLCEFDDSKEERVFGVEVFDEDMQPLGYKAIETIPILNEPGNTIGWNAEGVSPNGNIYIRERNRGKNNIWVLNFKWGDSDN